MIIGAFTTSLFSAFFAFGPAPEEAARTLDWKAALQARQATLVARQSPTTITITARKPEPAIKALPATPVRPPADGRTVGVHLDVWA